MNNNDLKKIRGVVREEIQESVKTEVRKAVKEGVRQIVKEELRPIQNELGTIKSELCTVKKRVDDIWEQTEKLSVDVSEIKESLGLQASATNHANSNVDRLDKRLTQVEEQHGIIPPAELSVIH